ncbi:MAG: hypothetical protein ACK514_17660 [Bacteroidota bacterium]|jgi:hypothetical protein|nr:hypothetical protein [Cytophagales bacterium]MCA6429610.1 hypothetical protein [Cytophagales bacterium]
MKKYLILKLVGLVLLTMITLVIISFAEVAVYSYLINPNQEQSVYEAHANTSAPYISGIFGFIVFFLVARYWKKKGYPDVFKLIVLFPLIYLVLDVIIITAAGVNWTDFFLIFAIANSSKFLGSFLGYKLTP